MSNLSREEVAVQARALSQADRAALVEELLDSLDGPLTPQTADEWERELMRRLEAYDRGETKPVDWEIVKAEARELSA